MKKVADFLDCAFLWSCRTFNQALSDTFHDWGPFMCRLSQCPRGRMVGCRRVHTCTCPTWPCLCTCLYQSCIKAGDFQNLTLHLHLVSDEYSGMLLEDYHLGSGKPGRDTFIIIWTLDKVSSFSWAWNFKYDKILKTSKEKSSCLPDSKTHFAEFCTHFTDFSPSVDFTKVFLTG